MSWFSELFGFEENSFLETKEKLKYVRKKGIITSIVNGKKYNCGRFYTPSLKELKKYAVKNGYSNSTKKTTQMFKKNTSEKQNN